MIRGDFIEMFKTMIMKGLDKISAETFVRRIDNDGTVGHNLRVERRKVNTVIRQGSFSQSS